MNALTESLNIMREAINQPIIKEVIPDTIFHHGTDVDDCEICDDEINEMNPGKKITYTDKGKKHVIHVCSICFADPDYIETLTRKENLKIETYKF
jgi:hypothetical protein